MASVMITRTFASQSRALLPSGVTSGFSGSARPTLQRRKAQRARLSVLAAAETPKSGRGLQKSVDQFLQRYDIVSAGVGALTVTSYCVWRGQDPATALSITFCATIAALVVNELLFEQQSK